jgi:phosphatidylserine/phosphatidylglycerophosphate/cardiolipin synthase-like enzyme
VVPADDRKFYPVVRDAIVGAKKSITVVQRSLKLGSRPRGDNPLPGQPASSINVFVDLLIGAAQRGVDVAVVLDQTTGFDSADSDLTAKKLKAGGVKVLNDDPENQTHAKFLTVDDDIVIVGSTNWTQPAVENGNEASVLVRSPEVHAVFQKYIDTVAAKGGEYKVDGKASSIWSADNSAD